MADAGFFRGTTSEQDARFGDKRKKLMKSMKFEPALAEKVNMEKVNLDIIKPWITERITQLLGGIEDEVLISYILELLESSKDPDPKELQIAVTGFLNGKNARVFMGELWTHLLSAQKNIGGIPTVFLEKKKEEIRLRKQETERIQDTLKRTQSVEADSTSRDVDKAKSLAKSIGYSLKRKRSESPPISFPTTETLTPVNQISIRKSLVGYMTSVPTSPQGRDKPGWYAEHEKHVEIAKTSSANVLLIGDSIIQGLARYPKVWSQYFTQLKALNFGLGGDRTQNVLWRIENGEIPLNAQTIVIHVGTNNTDRDNPKDIANGICSIGAVFQESKPNAKIIVTGLLPRDIQPSHRRTQNHKVNKYLKKMCRFGHARNFYYLKPDADWVLPDGTLNTMYYFQDHLHLVEEGDAKFAKSIANMIQDVYGDAKIEMSSDSEVSDGEENKNYSTEKVNSQHPRSPSSRSASPSPRRRSRSRSPRRRRYSRSPRRRSRSPRKNSRSPRRHSRRERSHRRRRSRSRSRSPRRRRSPSFSRSPSPKVKNSNLRELTKIPSPSLPKNIANKDQQSEREDSEEELVKIKPADEGLMRDDHETSPTAYSKSNKTEKRSYRRQQSDSDESDVEASRKEKEESASPIEKVSKKERLLDGDDQPRRKFTGRRSSPGRNRRSFDRQRRESPERLRRKNSSATPSPKRRRRASNESNRSTSPEVRKRRIMRKKREEEARERENERKMRLKESNERQIREREARDHERKLGQRLREKHRQRQRERRSPSASGSDGEEEKKPGLNRRQLLAEAERRMKQTSSDDEAAKKRSKRKQESEEEPEDRNHRGRSNKRQESADESEDDQVKRRRERRQRRDSEEVKATKVRHKRDKSSDEDEVPAEPTKMKGGKSRRDMSDSDEEVQEKPSRRNASSSDEEAAEKRKRRGDEPRTRQRKAQKDEHSDEMSDDNEEVSDRRRVVLKVKRDDRSSATRGARRKSRSASPKRRSMDEAESEEDAKRNDRTVSSEENSEEESEQESSPERRKRKQSKKDKKHKRRKSKKKSRRRRNHSDEDDDESDKSGGDGKSGDVEEELRERALKSMKNKRRSSESSG